MKSLGTAPVIGPLSQTMTTSTPVTAEHQIDGPRGNPW